MHPTIFITGARPTMPSSLPRRGLRSPIAPAAIAILLAAASLSEGGCASRRVIRRPPVPAEEPGVAKPAGAVASPSRGSWDPGGRMLVSEDFLIYPVQWGRAEDLAVTLEPIVKSLYGPEARVVAHVASNQLFIYRPLRRGSATAGSPAGGAPPAAGGARPAPGGGAAPSGR